MTLADRFWSKVTVGDWQECWPWTGGKTTHGYGMFYPAKGRSVCAHRQAFELVNGPIPDGLELDHVRAWGCRLRHCVNPLHLEPVTHTENVQRATCLITRCPQGHEYTPENTRVRRGRRECRACHRDRQRDYNRRVRAAR